MARKFLGLVFVLGAMTYASSLGASPASEHRVWSIIGFEREELPIDNLQSIEHMIEGGTRRQVHVYVPRDRVTAIESWGVDYEWIAEDVRDLRPQSSQKDIGGQYHTPQSMRDAVELMIASYPDLVRRSVVGYSVDGRPIDAIIISDSVQENETNEPCLRMVGAYHGDEWASVEVVIATAWALLSRYEEEPSIRKLVDDNEIWLIPMLNPDGVIDFDRKNKNGVDLNRNFSWAFERTPQSGSHPFSEPETLALYDLSMNRSFHHNLSVHSGAVNLGWVWNFQTGVSPDEDWFRFVGEQYLASTSSPEFWITNGAQWYMVNGEATDWLYGTRGGHDYTLEVSVEKAPPTATIPDLVEHHIDSVLGFFTTPGLRGRITDAQGNGLEASVSIGTAGASMLSDPLTGAFFRPMDSQIVSVEISSPGFETFTADVDADEFLNVVLSRAFDFEVDDYGGLTRGPWSTESAWIKSDDLAQYLASGGKLALFRLGVGEPYILSHEVENELVYINLNDVRRLTTEQRGFWDLLVLDSEGAVKLRFNLAVLFVEAFAGEESEFASLPVLSARDRGLYLLRVPTSEPGLDLHLLGPDFSRRTFTKRLGFNQGFAEFEVETETWSDGYWDLRIVHQGQYQGFGWRLKKGGDSLDWVWPNPPKTVQVFPEIEAVGGCQCQNSGTATWALLVWALVRIIRGRSKRLLNKA